MIDITLFQQYWKQILFVLIILFVIIISIVFRKKLKKKIKDETISFFGVVISIGLGLYGLIARPEIESTTLATIMGKEVSLVIPLVWVFAVILVIALIIFFRKELAKDIDLS